MYYQSLLFCVLGWPGMLSACKRKWCLLSVLGCEKLLWNSEEMGQIDGWEIHWKLLNTCLSEEVPALKIIGVCAYISYMLSLLLRCSLQLLLRVVGDGIQETLVWPSTPVLTLLGRLFLEAVASLFGNSLS